MSHRRKNYIVFATILSSFFLMLICTILATFVTTEILSTHGLGFGTHWADISNNYLISTIVITVAPISVLAIFVIAPIAFALLYFKVGNYLSFTQKYFRRATGSIIVTAIFIACGCQFVGFYVWQIYTTVPFPSPVPFADAKVEESWRDVGHGHYGTIGFEYEAEHSLADLEQYYNSEMAQYCVGQWQFVETKISCDGFTKCRMAECEIPRPFVESAQYFSVYLRSVSESQTNVPYIQKTINP